MTNEPIAMNPERKQALTHLKTARGQLDGIIRMVEQGRYCVDIAHQIMASQALLKKAQKLILMQHLSHCVASAVENEDPNERSEKLNEMKDLIRQLMEVK
ncbi:Repressor CsoR of the copZA operon [Clostridiaceae bacterium JG1575]|nr:Repressor CsoR of the copZA operon [Clostridiaceae bacterium JG1575]